ncbi:MAG TPA: hypothetical protein EYO42_04140 [Candidatus Poseidoniales archaeon]|nr:hypothetical protein [Candidatus Poseidoniales archaeon]
MGFFDTIGRGWKMSKLSMSVVRKDGELMVYVLLSGILSVGAMVAVGIPQALEQSWTTTSSGEMTPAYMAFVFSGYMMVSIIVTFWNSALIANAHIRLSGGDPSFGDGFSAAFKRIHIIIIWGIIAGTVGLLLKMLSNAGKNSRSGGGAALAMVIQIIGAAIWWMLTFFMIPHMVIEGKGIGDSMRSSKKMFFKTWGENISSGLGIGLITFLFGAIIVVATIVMVTVLGSMGYIGLIIGGLAIAVLIMWSSAAEQVAVAALYIYSKTGKMPQLYQEMGVKEYTFPTKTAA